MVKKVALACICCMLCASCAPMGSSSELEQRVERQDMQLRQIQPQQADTWNQVQAMREEIEDLRSQLNELNNAGGARVLAERVRQHDAALRAVDNNMALNLDLGDPMALRQPETSAPQAATISPSPANAPDSSAYANNGAPATGTAAIAVSQQPAQTGNYGLPPEPAQNPEYMPAEAPSESKWGQADPKPVEPAPQKDISLALLDAGINSFNSRDYAAAQRSFKDFLKNYPSHAQAAEAQNYLAECQFQQNQFAQAALDYDTVITKYSKSSFVPGAYYKQAICFSKMNNSAAAKARMQGLISKFPNSPEAARAKTFLKNNK